MNPAHCIQCGSSLPLGRNDGECARCLIQDVLAFPDVEESFTEGVIFGNYTLLEKLGHGGMGTVWKAQQQPSKRLVALKMMALYVTEPAAERRFRAEAEAAASLEHPLIVPVYDVGEIDGQLYFTMRLMEGGTLADPIPRPRDWREIAGLVESLARAVHFAHQRGILHRDLKTGNILLDAQGNVGVADFGLVHRLDAAASRFTVTGAVLGSPQTMAPEQASGTQEAPTVATDVYGLGTILYELMTGKPVFSGTHMISILHAVMQDQPVPPSTLRRDLPRDLETICLKCLEKSPGKRYATPLALAEDLAALSRGDPIKARPTTFTEKLLRTAKKYRSATAIIFLLPVFLAALLAQSVYHASSLQIERDEARSKGAEAVASQKIAEKAQQAAAKDRDQLADSLYASDMQLAWQTYHAKQPLQAARLLEKMQDRTVCFDYHLLAALLKAPTATDVITGFPGSPTALAWANGTKKLYVAGEGYLEQIDPASGKHTPLLPGAWEATNRLSGKECEDLLRQWVPGPWDPRFSNMPNTTAEWQAASATFFAGRFNRMTVSGDGTRLATGLSGGWAHLRSTEDGRPLAALPVIGAGMSLNHDGQRFLCGSTNPNTGKLAGVADLSAGPPFQILNGSGGLVAQSADGSVFVQGNGGDVLFLWKRGETTPYAEIPTGGWIGDVAVSPNGRWGVFSQQDSWKLCFFDLATKSIIRESPPHAHAIMSMAISPDSQWLGYLSDDTSLRLMPGPGATDTPKQTEWWGHAKTPTGITFLQDRHHLATTSSDGSLRLWHVTGTNESTYPSAPSTASNRQSLLFSPDGNWLAGTQWEGKVSVTNLHQRKTIELPISSGAVLGWTPAMELLVATTAAPRPVGAGPFFITRWAFTKTGPSKLESDPVRLENSDGPYGHWRLHQDGQLLVAADIKQQSVTVWNLQTGQCHGSDPMEGNIQNLAWSPNADRIAGSIYGVALIVAQSEDGGRLFTKRAAAPVHWLEFSPDGKMLAAANYRDRKVCLFNSASGKELAELNGHTRTVTQALFAPDGKILVTVSQDKTVRLWHLPTRRELTTLTTNAHYERVAISYGASGPRIIYLNESHAVRSLPDELFEH